MTTQKLIQALEYVRSRLFVAMTELEAGRPAAAAREMADAGRVLKAAAKETQA